MNWPLVTVGMTGFLALTFTVCALASWLRRDMGGELFAFAALVAVFTILSRVVSAYSDMPASAVLWPLQDMACAGVATAMWNNRPDRWKAAIASCFAIQCGAHVMYWWWVLTDGATWEATVAYLWIINPFFVVELSILTLAGGRLVADYVVSRRVVSLDNTPVHVAGHGGQG